MPKPRVLITDHGFPNLRHEETILAAAGAELVLSTMQPPARAAVVRSDAATTARRIDCQGSAKRISISSIMMFETGRDPRDVLLDAPRRARSLVRLTCVPQPVPP